MKILHTSDWHVGKTLRGHSRVQEHEAVLAEIAMIAGDEESDVVLVGGDLFDTAAPAPDAERIVYRALLDLAETGAHVVVIAGNHDNARRLQAVEPLLDMANVRIQPVPAAPDAGGVLDLQTRAGEWMRLALVPFLSQRYVVKAAELMGLAADEQQIHYAERVRRVVGALTAGFDEPGDRVNVVLAHLTLTGGSVGGGEREAHIFDYDVSPTIFPTSTHYVALGHLHRRQQVPGPCPIHYCGSPLQLDFGEVADDKAVISVEIEARKPAVVREVPLRAGRRLRTIQGSLADLANIAAETDAADDFLRVVVDEPQRAGLADEVRELLPTAVDVACVSPTVRRRQPNDARLGRSPRELFHEFLTQREIEDARIEALFAELIEEVDAPATP